jgi:hypothetical protein
MVPRISVGEISDSIMGVKTVDAPPAKPTPKRAITNIVMFGAME